jgi:hypothetical protein
MEYWDHSCSIWLKNNTVHGINKPWTVKTSTEDLKNSDILAPAVNFHEFILNLHKSGIMVSESVDINRPSVLTVIFKMIERSEPTRRYSTVLRFAFIVEHQEKVK